MDRRQVEALVKEQIAQALASQPPPLPAPAPEAPTKPTPPAGKKVCGKGHVYPTGKRECPQCVQLRQRATRARKAEARRGAIPAPAPASPEGA